MSPGWPNKANHPGYKTGFENIATESFKRSAYGCLKLSEPDHLSEKSDLKYLKSSVTQIFGFGYPNI